MGKADEKDKRLKSVTSGRNTNFILGGFLGGTRSERDGKTGSLIAPVRSSCGQRTLFAKLLWLFMIEVVSVFEEW